MIVPIKDGKVEKIPNLYKSADFYFYYCVSVCYGVLLNKDYQWQLAVTQVIWQINISTAYTACSLWEIIHAFHLDLLNMGSLTSYLSIQLSLMRRKCHCRGKDDPIQQSYLIHHTSYSLNIIAINL